MGKTWQPNKRDLKDFERSLRKGMTVYFTYDHATNLTGVWDAQTYSDATCTHKHPILGGWMFGGALSAKQLLMQHGPISDTPPRGIRYLGGPEPDCRDEGYRGLGRGQTYGGRLDPATIDYMEGHAQDATDERDKRAAQRGNKKGWF
jgi:hypothetical protein